MRSIVVRDKPLLQADAFHVVVGRKGAGKGTVLAAVASRVTRGELGEKCGVVWIGSEDKLPRLIWISPTQGQEKPRHSIEFSDWQLDAPVADGEFALSDAGKATRIEMARPESLENEK